MKMSLPFNDETVSLKHGAGGRSMRRLIEHLFLSEAVRHPIDGVGLVALDDGAALRLGDQWLVFTTDSHVVQPRFFPGGDIGRLSVAGTVNDLAMMGATEPLGLSCALILEDGFSIEELERIQRSMAAACEEAGAPIITGDTKVMGHGEVDGLVTNTAGIGLTKRLCTNDALEPGDQIIVSGSMGDHGFAVMAVRHKLDLTGRLVSDVGPVNHLVARVLYVAGEGVLAMTDPTRGGLASALNGLSRSSGVGIIIEEATIPITEPVRAAGELLGIDPLNVANEGKVVFGVRAEVAEAVLDALRSHPLGRDAERIGMAVEEHVGKVVLDTGFGRRLLPEPDGELLPRIC